MSKTIRTEIVIHASRQSVWAVLIDFAGHAAWDPFLTAIAGKPLVGERLEVRFNTGQTARPIVTEVREGQAFEWLGEAFGSWLFAARHRFELSDEGAGTRLVHSETFTGLLVPFFGRMLDKTEASFHDLNTALKNRVEAIDGGRAIPST